MLHDSSVAEVVRTRPRAIPLAMINMRKSTHGFPFVSPMMSMGLRLAALRAAGAPLLQNKLYVASSCMENGGNKQIVRNASGVAGDTCTWNELPERILTNNTDNCGKVHGVTFLESQACVVLLTFLQRL